MKPLIIRHIKLLACAGFFFCSPAKAHEIYFCGEAIPTSRDFVANKLMNVIRNQIPTVTLVQLRYQAQRYFPTISKWLKYYGIPDDFKYVPIVECGFRNLSSSKAGARGMWQLMPEVARELKLIMLPDYDERDNPTKATVAACQLIRQHYAVLQSNLRVSSWVLTAAAYNFGPGNIIKTVQRQGGTDYFNMQLNAETAEYVYRLIAVKELFEHPELYMNGFGANIFSTGSLSNQPGNIDINNLERGPANGSPDKDFGRIDLKVAKEGGRLAADTKTEYVAAHLINMSKKFSDGGMVTLLLDGDLQLNGSFRKKGGKVNGYGWIIDDRVYIDLGYGSEIEVLDKVLNKGLTEAEAGTNNQHVILKTYVDAD